MITKKQLGIGFVYLGALVIVGTILADVIGASSHEGIGPAQRLALIGGGVAIILGLTLVPFGNKPA